MTIPDFKIEYFHRELGEVDFPRWSVVPHSRHCEVIMKLALRLNVESDSPKNALCEIWQTAQSMRGANAEDETFRLTDVLDRIGFKSHDEVYVLWWNFGGMDILGFEDLSKYWQYLWYPASDWIFIFDDSLNWTIIVGPRGDLWCNYKKQ